MLSKEQQKVYKEQKRKFGLKLKGALKEVKKGISPTQALKNMVLADEQTMERPHKTCTCDQCLYYWYCPPCSGCKDGHPSFWKTVIESPQWKLWQKEQRKNPTRDMAEVEELGTISPKHFQEFLNFLKDTH